MTDILLDCWIPGRPRPQGSMRHVGKGHMAYSATTIAHRNRLIEVLATAWCGRVPIDEAVALSVDMYFHRPKAHYGTGRNAAVLKESAPLHKTTPLDTDKGCRLVADGLTIAGVIRDDALIVELLGRKCYDEGPERTHVQLRRMPTVGER